MNKLPVEVIAEMTGYGYFDPFAFCIRQFGSLTYSFLFSMFIAKKINLDGEKWNPYHSTL